MYSNCCCSCSCESEIIKIGQSSLEIYSNNILNFQESMTILNAHTKKARKPIVGTSYIYIETENSILLKYAQARSLHNKVMLCKCLDCLSKSARVKAN